MRTIAMIPVFFMLSAVALAEELPKVDLDRPGILNQLKAQHPKQFQAVNAVLSAAKQAPCSASEAKVLETRYEVRDIECGMILSTSYPALRHVSFELDGVNYSATVKLDADGAVHPLATAD